MAESNDSILQFDSGILDVNENLSNSENHLLSNSVQINESVSPNIQNVNLTDDVTICKQLTILSDNCSKMPDNFSEFITNNSEDLSHDSNDVTCNKESDSGVQDSDNFSQGIKLIDFNGVDLNLSNGFGGMIPEFNMEENCEDAKDEEFQDAVQFFKDPSSLTFLENAGTSSAPSEPLITRSSLYMNFDPLHAKFFPQPNKANDLQDIVECDAEPEIQGNSVPEILAINAEPEITAEEVSELNIVNKHLADISPRASLGNILISFDSPVIDKNTEVELIQKDKPNEPPKMYTEEEFQQALKIQELSLQDTFLKRQHDLELERTEKQNEMETKLKEQKLLCSTLHSILNEFFETIVTCSDKLVILQEKLEASEKERNKLKEDLKTSVEDLQSVESTFSDFHKRYEQCKSMLKVYTQNEGNFKLQLEDMKVQLNEKEEMYKVLQSRTQEMLDKANTEVSNAKKAGDAQIAVLKAQLKKAELKISSLESDVKHVKIENDKLSSICDDLMVKVSET